MRITRSILSILLAALVLVASSSFYLSSHSCGGRINKIAFLEKADGCGHALMPPCHRALMKGCCEDEVIAHDAQDLKFTSSLTVAPLLPSFHLPEPLVVLSEIIPDAATAHTRYFNYDTPLRSDDLLLVHRVLLI